MRYAIKDGNDFFTGDYCGIGATFLPGELNVFVVRYAGRDHAERVVAALRKHLPGSALHLVEVPSLTAEELRERAAHRRAAHRRPRQKRRGTNAR